MSRPMFCLFLLLIILTGSVQGATFAIISLNTDGSDVRMLAQDPKYNFGSVNVSRDGKRIAFDSWPTPKFEGLKQWVHVADIDGKGMRRVAKGAMPKWSPDGTTLAFQDYINGVVVTRLDGKGKEVVSPDNGNPSWLDNGNGMAVLEWSRNIQVLDLITGSKRRIDKNGIPGIVQGFAVSPDEERVVYSRHNGANDQFALVIARLDGSKPPRILRKGAICTGFGWHPDNRRIVFCEGTKAAQIFMMNVDDDVIVPVPGHEQASYVNPCFSPDGKRIFCSSTIR